MKRKSCLILLLLFSICLPNFSSANGIKITVDDKEIPFQYGNPTTVGGRTLVPIRDLLVGLGVKDDDEHIHYTQYKKEGQVTVRNLGRELSLTVGSKYYTIYTHEGIKQLETDVEPQIINDRIYLPARIVAESLGFGVDYDTVSNTISIHSMPEVLSLDPSDIKTFVGEYKRYDVNSSDMYSTLKIDNVAGKSADVTFFIVESGIGAIVKGTFTFNSQGYGSGTMSSQSHDYYDGEDHVYINNSIQANVKLGKGGVELSLQNKTLDFQLFSKNEADFVAFYRQKSNVTFNEYLLWLPIQDNRTLADAMFKNNITYDKSVKKLIITIPEISGLDYVEVSNSNPNLSFLEVGKTYVLDTSHKNFRLFMILRNGDLLAGGRLEKYIIFNAKSEYEKDLNVPKELDLVVYGTSSKSGPKSVSTIEAVIEGINK